MISEGNKKRQGQNDALLSLLSMILFFQRKKNEPKKAKPF